MKRVGIVVGLSLWGVAWGATPVWVGTTAVWGTASNWNPADVPSSSGDIAIFSAASPPNSPDLGAISYTIGGLTFQSTSASITISTGVGSLTLNNGSATSVITVANISDVVNPNLDLLTATSTSVAANSVLTLAGVISGSSLFTVGGAGTTILTNALNSYSGGLTINTGTLRASSVGCLGASGQAITIASGTLQAAGNLNLSALQNLTVTGVATLDTNSFSITIPGSVDGTGSLSQKGGGTLVLQGIGNGYQGGTVIQGPAATLVIYSDLSLGETSGGLSLMDSTTLTAGAAFTLNAARTTTLTGSVTMDTATFDCSILGPVVGATGALTTNSGPGVALTLLGENTYQGGTTVATGTLKGTTTGLQGTIHIDGTSALVFNQTTSGTYSGQISGVAGTTLTIEGGGSYTFTGSSAGSLSATSITGSSSLNLTATGSLGSSTTLIDAGSTVSGSGTLSTTSVVTNSGKIIPGENGSGTLIITGNVTFTAGSGALVSQLTPLTTGLLTVNGTGVATLTNGILEIDPDFNEFFGLSQSYTLLTATSLVGTFQPPVSSNSNFIYTVTYTPTEVLLELKVTRPFEQFACGNFNQCSVARNLDDLSADGLLTPGLSGLINSLIGQDVTVVQSALDQLHPAALSALAELQTELGGQFLSLSHRKPKSLCYCREPARFWVEPFGNWLHEKNQGMEIGFHAKTRGFAAGFDYNVTSWCTLGVSGAYNATDLKWDLDRGYSYVDGAYGAVYSDFVLDRFYMGLAAYMGRDWYRTVRHIQFTTIDYQATSHSDAMDVGFQWTSAYYFGTPLFLFYPYLTADYLYLNNDSFQEKGASALNLTVSSYTSQTLRTETGLTWEFTDRNTARTFCISPLFSLGYVMEWPIVRSYYEAVFAGESLSFLTRGWTQVWHLWNFRLGLGLTYRCFTLDSQYSIDVSPDGGTPFVNQRANFRMSYHF